MVNNTPGGCKTYIGGVLDLNMTETLENLFAVEITKVKVKPGYHFIALGPLYIIQKDFFKNTVSIAN